VDHVESDVAWAGFAHDGVGVSAVVVEECACAMDYLCDLPDPFVKRGRGCSGLSASMPQRQGRPWP